METDEEDNSKPLDRSLEFENESKLTTPPTTDMDKQDGLSNTEPQWETKSVAELHKPQFDSGDRELQQPPAPPHPVQTQTAVLDKGEDQDAVAGEDLSVAELSELEVRGGDGGEESKSPPPLSPQPLLAERVEGDVAGAEEESHGIEPPQPSQEVASKEGEEEEKDGDLISGEQRDGVVNNSDSGSKNKDEDVNFGVEGIESETEVVVGIAEKIETETMNKEIESRMAVQAEGTNATKELTMADKVESVEEADVAEEMDGAGMDDGAYEIYAAEEVEEEKLDAEGADLGEEKEEKATEQTEIIGIAEETEAAAEEMEEAVNEGKEMADMAEERDKEGEMHLVDSGEEMDMAEEADKTNEAEETEMAEETEGAEEEVEEVSRSAGGKRKRGKNAKAPARVSSRKKLEEDVCFICFDGGELVLCDRR